MTSKSTAHDIGAIGEEIAAHYLQNKGFALIARNYLKKYGEIDIIARKNNIIHFIEVKTVSHETKDDLQRAVSHETWRPEEQVHQFKLHQIQKTLSVWIEEHSYGGDWQIAIAAIRMVPREKYAQVKYLENVIL